MNSQEKNRLSEPMRGQFPCAEFERSRDRSTPSLNGCLKPVPTRAETEIGPFASIARVPSPSLSPSFLSQRAAMWITALLSDVEPLPSSAVSRSRDICGSGC